MAVTSKLTYLVLLWYLPTFFSFYRIIVEEVLSVEKRSLPGTVVDADSDYYKAKMEGSRVYVAAQITQDKASGPFEVGDNKTYSGFYNAPLNPNKKYNIWFGAYSEVDGVSVYVMIVLFTLGDDCFI